MISKADISDWEANPVTKAIIKTLGKASLESLSNIAIMETCDETAMRTAESVGFANGCLSIVEAVEELKEDCQ